jgi:N-acetylglucosamine kinase-like BadF-type ATPase
MYNPYGGSGSIVMPPRQVRGTSTRLGSRGWRLTDTTHGKAMRRKRNAIASAGERILPTLSDEQTDIIMAQLREQLDGDRSHLVNINIHNK